MVKELREKRPVLATVNFYKLESFRKGISTEKMQMCVNKRSIGEDRTAGNSTASQRGLVGGKEDVK